MRVNPADARRDNDARVTPRRIAVYGPSGSGKTTFGRCIGALLGLPVVELDALFHRPNWEPTPEDEFRTKVLTILGDHRDGWVCEGNYRAVRGDVMRMADTIVWLRPPFRVAYWRLWKRTLTRSWTKEPLWGTNYESWRMAFLSRDSILLWGISHWRAHARGLAKTLAETPHDAPLHVLRSARDLEDFLDSLGANVPSRTSA